MKVLTLLNGLGMGGAEHMAYELIKNLDSRNVETLVFCYGPKVGTPLEEEMAKVADLKFGNLQGHITPFHMIKMLFLISKYNPDIIHAHMGGVTFGIPWCLLHKKPIVITVHTRPDVAFSKKNQKLIHRALDEKLCYIVAVSEENLKFVKNYYGITDEECGFVNNGINTEKFYRKKHGKFTFINVARQDENKNQEAIIRCFASIHNLYPNTMLYLVGDGPRHGNLVNLVANLGLQESIILPGLINNPEDYYAIADVYVQSSHREAMPLSVLEAMAAGLPIISTEVGGLRDVVQGNGKLIPDNNIEKLEEAMRWILTVPSTERKSMELMSKKLSEDYSSYKMAQSYQKIYSAVSRRD